MNKWFKIPKNNYKTLQDFVLGSYLGWASEWWGHEFLHPCELALAQGATLIDLCLYFIPFYIEFLIGSKVFKSVSKEDPIGAN